MLQTIVGAIHDRKILSFYYDGLERVVEPHAVGISRAGNDVLRCYQVQGKHVNSGHDWNLCDISKMSNLSMTGAVFDSARPGYKKGDKGMRHIYAEL